MHDLLVLKILDSQSVSVPSTLLYGEVELRSYKSDSKQELDALEKSAINSRANFDQYSFCARIACIVKAENKHEAISLAESAFSKVLDLKSVEFATSTFKTSNIGFVKDLKTGDITPLTRDGFEPSISFVVHQGSIQRVDVVNYILSLETELSERYQRSLHWLRNSKHEKNSQLKILFYWFAVEALVKKAKTDNIGEVIRWFLGFPNGKKGNDVSEQLLNTLSGHASYKFWSRKLPKLVDEIRVFRNDSVHSGFRSMDFTKEKLELYNQIMMMGASRCQAAVQRALLKGVSTVEGFKKDIPVIFEENENLVNDTHGNILFALDRIKGAKI